MTSPDELEESKALKRLLTSLAQNYYEGDDGPVEVRWTDKTPHAGMDGSTPVVHVNVADPHEIYGATGAHALRLLVDTLSHEVQHHNDSKIEGKEAFMEEHDDGYAKLAGMVINVLEDNHIDHSRHRSYRGLKKVHDWSIAHQMRDDDQRPPMGELPARKQAVEGFIQLAFAGQVKGMADADPEVREALTDVAPVCERIKQTDDPEAREDMANQVTYRLREVIPERPDTPDWLEDLIRDLLEDLVRDHFDPADAPDDENFDPSEVEDTDEAPEDTPEETEEADEDAEDAENDETGAAGDEEGQGEGDDESGVSRRLTELTDGRESASHIRLE